MKKICILLTVLMVFTLSLPAFSESTALITRGEFVKEVLDAANMQIEKTEKSSFKDVTDESYIPYIETAYNHGYVSGYGELFMPESFITKEQAITVLVKIFGEKAGLNLVAVTPDFGANMSPWAKAYVAYAMENNMVKNLVNPKGFLSLDEAHSLIEQSKAVYNEFFTREGLTASDLLILSNEKNNTFKTMKQKATLDMSMKMVVEGIPQEKLETIPDFQPLLNEGMKMNLDMSIYFENPDKAYVKQMMKPEIQQPGLDQEIEVFMNGNMMYTRMKPSEKWMVQDMGSLMGKLQSLSNNDPHKMSQFSAQELEIFKDYAHFGMDEEVDGVEYYVVKIDIDKDAYKEYFMEILDKTMDSIVEMQMENPLLKDDPNFNPEQYRQMMNQMIGQMEIELSYKFYINKITKSYEKMWISQGTYVPMNNLIPQLGEDVLGDSPENITLKMLTHLEGMFNLYDINVEITFPVITAEDLMK